ncbi:MAG TPA: ABC transporter ATP-binding protein [Candidatus Bathyarchaeia archaeon]|nr:ABC transporter ATP-binding protein [Candidatus Bathyarchaeia archaeon]
MTKIVELKNISKLYTEKVRALDNVSLTFDKGEWLTILGPSGSGKSTLLNIIGGLDKPNEGYAFVDGFNITQLSQSDLTKFRREHVGFVFQQFHLVPYLTATENVMLAQYFHSIADEEEAATALKNLGLGHRLNHLPSQLSSGELQRVCIARALINEPKVLLADEPTGNLDHQNECTVLDIFKQLNRKGLTIIIVTHNPEIANLGNFAIRLEHGKVVADSQR